jgi:hypothetical protein
MLKKLFLLFIVVIFAFPLTASAENNYLEIITYASLNAKVTRVHSNKGHVWLDQGKDVGFIIGAKVCFFSSSDELIACGNVITTKPSWCRVHVEKCCGRIRKSGVRAALMKIDSLELSNP